MCDFFGRLVRFNCKIPQKISLRTSHIQNAAMLALWMMKLKKAKSLVYDGREAYLAHRRSEKRVKDFSRKS
jgi:hypothetical protein